MTKSNVKSKDWKVNDSCLKCDLFKVTTSEAQDMPNGEDLLSVESYQKVHQQILKCGRQTYEVPKSVGVEEMEEFLQSAQEQDPMVPPLEALSGEAAGDWLIKLEGDPTLITSANGEDAANREVVHLRNKNWKGSHNVYDPSSKEWAFFYCGYGLNHKQQIYPMKFYPIQSTSLEMKEYPEPNGELIEEKEEDQEEVPDTEEHDPNSGGSEVGEPEDLEPENGED
jgi:hypothetical protein